MPFLALVLLTTGLHLGNTHATHLLPHQTAVTRYLKNLTPSNTSSLLPGVDRIYVINLDERPQKWERMESLLRQQGLQAQRVPAINGWNLAKPAVKALIGNYPQRMNGGQMGCLLSHLSAIRDAYKNGYNRAWILEDDVAFVGDVQQIPYLLQALTTIDPEWDIFYTDVDWTGEQAAAGFQGGAFHNDFCEWWLHVDSQNRICMRWSAVPLRPDQEPQTFDPFAPREEVVDGIARLQCRQGMHSWILSRNGLKKVLDYYTHTYFWSPLDVDTHYIPNLRQYAATKDIVCCAETPISDTRSAP